MTLKELADKLESLDVNVFANILGLEYTHDEQPEQAKKMIIDALRFSEENGLKRTVRSSMTLTRSRHLER
ncbi:MAG TPA: hypothetical protein VHT68_01790 [Pseudolabrys sp.]|jgi:hypothetical protein|nr:hypothetical protein [Pseudolabrys sp.]